jgi:hypothetical protein
MAFKILPALAMLLLLAAKVAAGTAETAAPDPTVRIGTTEKICQLTGDTDWETGRPTAGRTFSNFGLDATDLGYPVEHAGKLILLFGDSWPPRHPGGTIREVPPDDAVGVVIRREAPTNDGKCLEMQVHQKFGAKTFAPATIISPAPIKQGFFNVPSGGVSGADGLYAFFWTDHCSDPNPLRPPSPDDPLARPESNRRLHAGCRLGSLRTSPKLIPEDGSTPGFGIV